MRRLGDALSSAPSPAARAATPPLFIALAGALVLLVGCAGGPAPTPASTGTPPSRTSASPATSLTPAQALAPGRRGTPVRWAGGIQRVEPREGGGQCFTLLYAAFDAQGVPKWTREPAYFRACSPGHYDAQLVQPFTRVAIDGRLGEPGRFLGEAVPTVEIDALERHSDCLASETDFVAHPECRSGLLRPQ